MFHLMPICVIFDYIYFDLGGNTDVGSLLV